MSGTVENTPAAECGQVAQRRVLPGYCWRTLYNVIDAVRKEAPNELPALDPAPVLTNLMRRSRTLHPDAVAWVLRGLEAHAWLRYGRSFSWLPREQRRRLFARWRHCPLPWPRRAATALYALAHVGVEEMRGRRSALARSGDSSI